MPVMNYLTTCYFDFGALEQLGAVLRRLGVKRPLLVSDPGLKAIGLVDRAVAQIPGGAAAIFDQTPANPTEEAATAATALYKEAGCDGIIALGGGSSMDLAKAVGLMANHEPPWAKYGSTQKGTKHIGKLPPLVAIPTTAGTGSEVSVGAVLILEDGRKETFISNFLIPSVAICDPDLTLGLPPGLTAATGMDAFTHCMEAVLSPVVHPPAEAIGIDGVERIYARGWLKRAVENGADQTARWHMMMASFSGALAFVKGLGAVHGLSHALGRNKALKLHHGTLNAVILPHSLAMLDGHAEEKKARLRKAMELPANADLAKAVADFNAALGIPPSLSAIGVQASHLEDALAYAVSDLATGSNAREFGEAEYRELFARAL